MGPINYESLFVTMFCRRPPDYTAVFEVQGDRPGIRQHQLRFLQLQRAQVVSLFPCISSVLLIFLHIDLFD